MKNRKENATIKFKKALSGLLIFALTFMMIPMSIFTAGEYKIQRSTVKSKVAWSFSVNSDTKVRECNAAHGDSISGTAAVTPTEGYEFDKAIEKFKFVISEGNTLKMVSDARVYLNKIQ